MVFGRYRQVARSSRITRSFVFYGAFAARVLRVHSRRLPGWVLSAAGGTLAIFIGALWYTSALWYYHGYQLPAI